MWKRDLQCPTIIRALEELAVLWPYRIGRRPGICRQIGTVKIEALIPTRSRVPAAGCQVTADCLTLTLVSLYVDRMDMSVQKSADRLPSLWPTMSP